MKGVIKIDTEERFEDTGSFDYQIYNCCDSLGWNILEVDYLSDLGLIHNGQVILDDLDIQQLDCSFVNNTDQEPQSGPEPQGGPEREVKDDGDKYLDDILAERKSKCSKCSYCKIHEDFHQHNKKYYWFHGYITPVQTDTTNYLIKPHGLTFRSDQHERDIHIGVKGAWIHILLA